MSAVRRALVAALSAVLALALAAPASAAPLQDDFTRLAGTIPATIGIAYAPVGQNGAATLGKLQSGVAWSTIKVPLAIAAMHAGVPNAQDLAARAVTASDNDAAEKLWSELGPAPQAAQQVQAVLRAGGDPGTAVESRRLRPEFSAFGQTQWPLARQAVFAAHLPCLPAARQVYNLMNNTIPDQRWGLAGLSVPSKAGWGPGPGGGYLVRQFGVVRTPHGDLAVALAAEPNDGSFSSGIAALNQMTQWLNSHAAELPGGRCAG
ncbi:hypothetical protein MU0083_003402 [[Mycobacterium] kokjensenii]|uniref:Serine hydrolase n=1 Tax=[Mycobacterium] kokjensenii TaxID=3064287 RepID=A0ABN9NGN1_9MYCO|nr:hypothetical protein [Mycolicibacter sp. MU0083]CAJ1504301.1 hypothetical protein MU0083_003402 [Mycolicibacter sp. MU0083]